MVTRQHNFDCVRGNPARVVRLAGTARTALLLMAAAFVTSTLQPWQIVADAQNTPPTFPPSAPPRKEKAAPQRKAKATRSKAIAKDKNDSPVVLVVSDADDENAESFLPTADAPVYYFFAGHKEKVIGGAYDGEKYPPREVIEAGIVKALASQGYVRTQAGGPKPSLVIMATWGTASVLTGEIQRDADDGDITFAYNMREIRKLVGAHKTAARGSADPFEISEISEAMSDYRVYVMIGAFDAEALVNKQRRLIWRTSMSIDTLAYSFPASLDTMLVSAAPYFGRNTGKGLVIDERMRRARVEFGEATIISDDSENPPAQQSTRQPHSQNKDQPDSQPSQ